LSLLHKAYTVVTVNCSQERIPPMGIIDIKVQTI